MWLLLKKYFKYKYLLEDINDDIFNNDIYNRSWVISNLNRTNSHFYLYMNNNLHFNNINMFYNSKFQDTNITVDYNYDNYYIDLFYKDVELHKKKINELINEL